MPYNTSTADEEKMGARSWVFRLWLLLVFFFRSTNYLCETNNTSTYQNEYIFHTLYVNSIGEEEEEEKRCHVMINDMHK